MEQNEIFIKCRLCKQFHDYEFNADKINALEANWRSLEDLGILLDSHPLIGKQYVLTLYRSLKLRIDKPFWVLYQNASSSLNGIDSEDDIRDLSFCKCEFVNLLHQEEHLANIEVKVLEIKNLDSLTEPYKPAISWWSLFEDLDTFEKYGSIENFNKYSIIRINVQSDLGINLIILKEAGESRIAAVNDWDFHLNEWNLCNIKLTKEDEKMYGIQHGDRL